jgi:hypothetical protein
MPAICRGICWKRSEKFQANRVPHSNELKQTIFKEVILEESTDAVFFQSSSVLENKKDASSMTFIVVHKSDELKRAYHDSQFLSPFALAARLRRCRCVRVAMAWRYSLSLMRCAAFCSIRFANSRPKY